MVAAPVVSYLACAEATYQLEKYCAKVVNYTSRLLVRLWYQRWSTMQVGNQTKKWL